MTEERWEAFVAAGDVVEERADSLWDIEWITTANDERIVIHPKDDLVAHDLEGDCACGPYIEHLSERDWLYMHHSLDDRESLEDLE